MKNILYIKSSPRGPQSYSQKVAQSIVDELQTSHPAANVVVRNLAQNPPPHVGEAFVGGISIPSDQRNPEQSAALNISDALIDELAAADIVVLAVPMHNFGPPSTLKAWIDHVVRVGRTVSYSQKGPEGALKGKRAIIVVARGGVYSDGPARPFDFQEPYLRHLLGFMGLADVAFIHTEKIGFGPGAREAALIGAREKISVFCSQGLRKAA